ASYSFSEVYFNGNAWGFIQSLFIYYHVPKSLVYFSKGPKPDFGVPGSRKHWHRSLLGESLTHTHTHITHTHYTHTHTHTTHYTHTHTTHTHITHTHITHTHITHTHT